MAGINNNKDLLKLMEHAEQIMQEHEIKSGSMTAEKLLVAVLDKASDLLFQREHPQIMETVTRYFGSSAEEWKRAMEQLLAYIAGTQTSFLDSLYMSRKQEEAMKAAQKASMTEITPEVLLPLILTDPSKTIRGIIRTDKKEGGSKPPSDPPSWGGGDKEAPVRRHEEKTEEDPEEDPEAPAAPAAEDSTGKLVSFTVGARQFRDKLLEVVYGQNYAVSVFASGYFQAAVTSLTDHDRVRPRATYLLAGPPGVGKTFIAETAARILDKPFKRFDMSEYTSSITIGELCGTDEGIRGAKEGDLTSFVRKNPECVILFDEIEKADSSIINLFLQILDAGRIRDNKTNMTVSFRDAVLVFTTNAGKQLYESSETGDFSDVSRKVILDALGKDINPLTGEPFFPPAICSRFSMGNVVMMNRIMPENLLAIERNAFRRLESGYEREFGIRFDVDDRVFMALMFGLGGEADARSVRNRAETFFSDEVYELLRLISARVSPDALEKLGTIRVEMDVGDVPEICELFEPKEKTEVLLFSCGGRLTETECCRYTETDSIEEATAILKKQHPRFVVLNPRVGMEANSEFLNIEDIRSESRDLLRILLEQYRDIPVFLLESTDRPLDGEEKYSYLSDGVRGFLTDDEKLAEQIDRISGELYLQQSMKELGRTNRLLTFETAQIFNGDQAVIRLFDFRMSTAVAAEDSKNVLNSLSRPDISFDDVIGAEDAKEELRYFVNYMKNPRGFMAAGVMPPKGVILYGPPGTGKTMLAKAMASESGATFLTAEGNQFLKKYVGEGPEKVHELFRAARRYAPSVLFVDEIDSIAKERNGSEHSNITADVLTAFLAEMDGFKSDPSRPVFVLAATNFEVEPGTARSLDAALMRRFDRRICVDLPNREERIRFLRLKMKKQPLLALSEEELTSIGIRSTGMSLAALESVIELALRTALRSGLPAVTDAVFDEAFETFNAGEKKTWDAALLERAARHEAGHAYICWKGGETPSYLTVVARSNFGGYMRHGDQEGKELFTRDELRAKIRTSLSGRAAEIVYYGDDEGVSTGAAGDLESATSLAIRMICSYGMDETFGLASVDAQSARMGEASSEVRRAVNGILAEEMQTAIALIREGKPVIDRLVELLMEKNHLTGPEMEAVFRGI